MEEVVITKRVDIKPYKSMYEFTQAGLLTLNGINFEYEPHTLRYFVPVTSGECLSCKTNEVIRWRNYTPDFWFPKSKIYVETKGKFTSDARTSMAFIVDQGNNVRMVFMHDNWISKKHSMRYSRWCELNNIEYAIGNIPLEWVSEDADNH